MTFADHIQVLMQIKQTESFSKEKSNPIKNTAINTMTKWSNSKNSMSLKIKKSPNVKKKSSQLKQLFKIIQS